MRDRHVLETVLMRRFPGAPHDQIAAAANAIMALIDQWSSDDSPAPLLADPVDGGRDKQLKPTIGH